MNYELAIQRLRNNEYRVVEGVDVGLEETKRIWLQVEVSPFAIYSNIEKIKRFLPDMLVRSGGTNGGTGVIYIQSK